MKTIGMIGGFQPESVSDYYEKIRHKIYEFYGETTPVKVIIYDADFEEIREWILTGHWENVEKKVENLAISLEQLGADAIVLAGNWNGQIEYQVEDRLDIPFIHIVDCIGEKCREERIRNVAFLGTNSIMTDEFLGDRLYFNCVDMAIPEDIEDRNELDRIISEELSLGIVKEKSKEFFTKLIQKMVEEYEIEGVILVCNELQRLFDQEDLEIPLFDPTEIHIDHIIRYILEDRDYLLLNNNQKVKRKE